MDKLRQMEVFTSTVEFGSFRLAAHALGMSSVMVGKYVRALELTLGVTLIERTTRRLSVTESGYAFYTEAKLALDQVRNAYEKVEVLQQAPSGLLRISAPMTLGTSFVAPLVAEFLRTHPDVRLELILSNSVVDLAVEGFDAAFRIAHLGDIDLVARPLQPYQMRVCASPQYLQRYGVPASPHDLANHRLLVHSTWNSRFAWPFLDDGREIPWPERWVLKSNDGQTLRVAALNDVGILMQPAFLVADDIAAGSLVSLLDAYLPLPRPVHLIYPRQRALLPKMAAFVDFVLKRLSDETV
jgi:DNA-binding transcriptional LysR family regulator